LTADGREKLMIPLQSTSASKKLKMHFTSGFKPTTKIVISNETIKVNQIDRKQK